MNAADKVWTVADVMVEDVVSVSPATPYRRLVELLWTHGISGLPVVDEAGVLVGIVSESDLLRHQEGDVEAGADRAEVAGDVMTAPVVTVRAAAELPEAAHLMRGRGLKRLPVLDEEGRLAGIVSRADLLKVFLRSEETLEWDVQELVRRHLGAAPGVQARIQDGVVSLEGGVASAEEAKRLVQGVRRLAGVVAVRDGLKPGVGAAVT